MKIREWKYYLETVVIVGRNVIHSFRLVSFENKFVLKLENFQNSTLIIGQ